MGKAIQQPSDVGTEMQKPRVIDYCGEKIEITPYEAKHRPDMQTCEEGIPVNPNLRVGFDCTPNEERDPLEIRDWWGRPFIRTTSWDEMSCSYTKYLDRVKGIRDFTPRPQDEYEAEQEAERKKWYKQWPSGTRFDVRCLDGGAWDRSTCLAFCKTLKKAIQVARASFGCY